MEVVSRMIRMSWRSKHEYKLNNHLEERVPFVDVRKGRLEMVSRVQRGR